MVVSMFVHLLPFLFTLGFVLAKPVMQNALSQPLDSVGGVTFGHERKRFDSGFNSFGRLEDKNFLTQESFQQYLAKRYLQLLTRLHLVLDEMNSDDHEEAFLFYEPERCICFFVDFIINEYFQHLDPSDIEYPVMAFEELSEPVYFMDGLKQDDVEIANADHYRVPRSLDSLQGVTLGKQQKRSKFPLKRNFNSFKNWPNLLFGKGYVADDPTKELIGKGSESHLLPFYSQGNAQHEVNQASFQNTADGSLNKEHNSSASVEDRETSLGRSNDSDIPTHSGQGKLPRKIFFQ